ncbi:DUF3048 domain-containing protein [Streptomyces resistomycificus]|uniref:CchlO n=1 Tax=Streptomyces resistomycificus TaxID=67356 RepID=A0A0L8KTY2_9ACTN|nr:DUF3048 domain-containing protein [Streptomyces resistomycificus]KOG29411.1 hypothetical protein ADK37_36580 [Streptomyces resistomycificus]KUO01876.1 hypothetical protein AQJ84_03780 [Streptomyces resistomycificus]
MGHRARTRRAVTTVALLAVTATASLAAGCTGGRGAVEDGRGQLRTPAESPAERPAESPGTGERSAAAGSVLAVKIDNVLAARPQTGLDSADIVYAEQVEGGLSRLMAVYATRLPKAVGPVRSARESDLELLRQFDRPTLAFSGAQGKLMPLIDKAPLDGRTPEEVTDAYYRGTDKPAPHNLYLRPDRLSAPAPGAAALTTGFRFGAAPEGGVRQTTHTVRYPAARFTFTWSADRDRWLVSMDGTPTVTTDGRRVAPATVVVQYVKVRKSAFRDFLGNNTPYTETVGSGKATVLRDGRAHEVRWSRARATEGTEFTTGSGAPVNFAEGQVWVVFQKAS